MSDKEKLARETFEHWLSDEGRSPGAVDRNSSGDYRLSLASISWRAWQAAWDTAPRASTEGGEEIARVLYQCEKRRADHSDKVMGLTHSTMEPWEECKETFLADAAEVLAALSTNPTAGEGWRPIETAPKDGTHVQFYGKQLPHEMVNFPHPIVFSGYWDACDEAWCSTGSTWRGPFYEPTHWMPLPPAPAAPAKGE